MKRVELTAGEEHQGLRLDQFLAASDLVTRSAAQRLIAEGHVTINGKPVPKRTAVTSGDRVILAMPDPVAYEAAAEAIPLTIVYEDPHLLVVDKPKGMVVHPAAGHYEGTLVNALLHHCGDSLSGIGGVVRPGIIHRIDKDTSGLLLVAKHDEAHLKLSEQLRDHSMNRIYYAAVYGTPREPVGTLDLPIGRHTKERKKMAVVQGGRRAVTHYEVIERLRGFSVLKLQLETGRTHQIRVHMAHLGHPLVGDTLYGPKKAITETGGQCLHAATLGFIHPATGEPLHFTSELPTYFTQFIDKHR